ncbi:MAG: DNA pilot protein [Microviridae sp.]|nr:MAG: DNA pilot protein [Microviridae sp.]
MLDALISAGANLLGGMLNRSSQSDFNQQQLQIAQQNMALQKEFAQHGISWKVDDAKAAGLHPLAALGAQTSSFSPVSLGGEAPKFDFSSLGQDLSRAAKAASTEEQRRLVDERKERELDIESKSLDNDIKRSTLGSRVLSTSRAGGQIGPPMPLPRGWEGMVGGSRSPERISSIATNPGEPKISEAEGASTKRMNLWGVYPMELNPQVTSGQALENEYGEFGGSAMAIPNIPAHFIHDYRKNGWPRLRMPSWKFGPLEYRRRD